jgi:hypothetical protein
MIYYRVYKLSKVTADPYLKAYTQEFLFDTHIKRSKFCRDTPTIVKRFNVRKVFEYFADYTLHALFIADTKLLTDFIISFFFFVFFMSEV